MPYRVLQLPACVRGDSVNTAIIEWLAANEIPVRDTPWDARFVISEAKDGPDGWPAYIQIEQFDCNVDPRFAGYRTVSFITRSFVKTERGFRMKAPISGFVPVEVMSVSTSVQADAGPAVPAMSEISGGA